jgi:kynurenine formamidase
MRPDIVKGLSVDEKKFPPSYGHKTLLKAGIYMLESLGGEIDEIVNKRVDLIALPLKYEGVEAAQVRAFALMD